MDFKEFFLERKSWGNYTILAEKLSEEIIKNIQSGELSIAIGHNTKRIMVSGVPIDVKLIPFNQTKNKSKQLAYFVPKKTHVSTKRIIDILSNKSNEFLKEGEIVIFFFDLFPELNKYKNNLIEYFKSLRTNYSILNRIKDALAHEISHAIDFAKSVSDHGKSTTNLSANDYYNDREELQAHLIQKLTPLNEHWKDELQKGVWLSKYSNKLLINKISKKIIDNTEFISFLTPNNKRKYMKGVYTTVQFLWEKYYNWSKQHNKKEEVELNDLMKFIKNV